MTGSRVSRTRTIWRRQYFRLTLEMPFPLGVEKEKPQAVRIKDERTFFSGRITTKEHETHDSSGPVRVCTGKRAFRVPRESDRCRVARPRRSGAVSPPPPSRGGRLVFIFIIIPVTPRPPSASPRRSEKAISYHNDVGGFSPGKHIWSAGNPTQTVSLLSFVRVCACFAVDEIRVSPPLTLAVYVGQTQYTKFGFPFLTRVYTRDTNRRYCRPLVCVCVRPVSYR